jgi:hypothetical protein
MSTAIIFWVLVLIALIYGVVIFNALVQIKHNVSKAWSNIDVLLKQRHDELPKLVETCRQYKQFEQETLRRVTEARPGFRPPARPRTFPPWAWRKAPCAPGWDRYSRWSRPIPNCAPTNSSTS